MRIRTLLITSYLLLIVVPFTLFFTLYYEISRRTILDIAQRNIYEMGERTSRLFDEQLLAVEEASRMIVIDDTLYDVFSSTGYSPGQLALNDRNVSRILDQYYPQRGQDYTVSLITPDMVYGSPVYSSMGDFYTSQVYADAVRHDGSLLWAPTWTLRDEVVGTDSMGARIGDVYRFSAVRMLNPMKLIHSPVFENMPEELPRPVLVISFSEEYVRQRFDGAVALEGFSYCISDRDGKLVAHSGDVSSTREEIPWLERAARERSGLFIGDYRGERMVVSYMVSDVTGWVASFMVPYDSLLGSVASLRDATGGFTAVLIAVTTLFACVISMRVTGPMHELGEAVQRAGTGDFGQRLPIRRMDEIGRLMSHFNDMNEQLHTLVDENYKTKLREKESEIAVLNIQLNPHFLYNTLNIINLEAMDCGAVPVSRMLISLSRMLQYTVMNHNESASFQSDLDWLRDYVKIMQLRHGERYTVSFRVDPELGRTLVPRLFLQPLLENAMLHGMHGITAGGEIVVEGRLERESRCFSVEDNGAGVPPEELDEMERGVFRGVGLPNVRRRIQLMYGEDYGLTVRPREGGGTVVTVRLPREKT